ncbi:MAG TPA: hypothetical protein VGP24_07980 [Glaciihabitans sp.]|jgi:hypothetical protein|nr:hypothetical protein [Glaciihabitans sp.]
MAAKLGLDPDAVNTIRAALAAQVDALDPIAEELGQSQSASLNPLGYGLFPGSIVISAFSFFTVRAAQTNIQNAAASARALLGTLAAQVNEQIDASAGGAQFGTMTAPVALGLYDSVLADASILEDYTPEQVAAFWAHLNCDPAAQQALVDAHPIIFGNLSGIPFETRARANVLNAQAALSDPEISDAMRSYLERVVDPNAKKPVQLVTFDPANERIVEMIGEMTEDTTDVITYVPGTTTNMESLYGGGVQKISERMVSLHPETVAFVYKDGLFPGGAGGSLATGIPEANDADYALAAGETLAEFTSDVQREPLLADATSTAIAHSWGLANVTSSEVAGAEYDNVVSLAGAWMPQAWEANPDTDYSSHTYVDWLYLAQETGQVGGGKFPRGNEDFPVNVIYDGPDEEVAEVWGMKYPDPAVMNDNHNLVATTSGDNNAVLAAIENDIYGE